MSENPRKTRRQPLRPKSGSRRPTNPLPDDVDPMQKPAHSQQPVERVVIVKESGGNPILKIIMLPFIKIYQSVMWLVRVIIGAMLRSVISFIFGILLMVITVAFIGVYGISLVDSNMDAIQALSLSVERIITFFQLMVGIQEAADGIPTAIPSL